MIKIFGQSSEILKSIASEIVRTPSAAYLEIGIYTPGI